MTGAAVHRLRLKAAHEDDVRRGAILLADALHIATLPQARDLRHYVVRHFDVGAFARDAAPQTIALAIERRLADVVAHAVPAESPSAATAQAVWFADEGTAIAALAERLAENRAPTEWFWRSVGARVALEAPRPAALMACLDAAAGIDGAPRALAQVVDRAERARGGAILATLSEQQAEGLLVRAFGVPAPAPRADEAPVAPSLPERHAELQAALHSVAPEWRARIETWLPRWCADARAVWLVALALVDAGFAPSSPDRVVVRARALVEQYVALTRTSVRGEQPLPSPSATPAAPSSASDEPHGFRDPAVHHDSPAEMPGRDLELPRIGVAPTPAIDGDDGHAPFEPSPVPPIARAPARTPIDAEGQTAVGGLLFLIRPLTLLGLPRWLEGHPWAADSAFPARLLAGIAREHGAPDDDPLLRALTEDPATADPALDRPRVRRVWVRLLERWLRRNTPLTLSEVVVRPARLACTRTHIDVCFHLRDAQIEVRLAGLDVDPGWVVWLGRVVRFHYLEGDRA